MHVTLHLTNACNLACGYCYECHQKDYMTVETAKKAALLAAGKGQSSCGIVFFGGEPLLCRDVIYRTAAACRDMENALNTRFHFKITTNGTLLDREFLDYSRKNRILIALSHDGTKRAHDFFRRHKDGRGSYDELESVTEELLAAHPYAPVMMTVCPETVGEYARGIKELWNKGFRYFICSLNYAGAWDNGSVSQLKSQYSELAEFYYEMTCREEKFYFSPFEVKIASWIKGDAYCHERCELGLKQISVAPDGVLYPCTQFAGHRGYAIGTVDEGIDQAKRQRLYAQSRGDKPECSGCAVKQRCNCTCGCLNYQVTGSVRQVAPMLCTHERLIFPIADKLAARLYRQRNGMFIQKHYNDMFPLISLVEDKTGKGGKEK